MVVVLKQNNMAPFKMKSPLKQKKMRRLTGTPSEKAKFFKQAKKRAGDMFKRFGAKTGHGTIKDLVKKAAGKRSLGILGMLTSTSASADQPGTGKHGGKKMTKYNPKTG